MARKLNMAWFFLVAIAFMVCFCNVNQDEQLKGSDKLRFRSWAYFCNAEICDMLSQNPGIDQSVFAQAIADRLRDVLRVFDQAQDYLFMLNLNLADWTDHVRHGKETFVFVIIHKKSRSIYVINTKNEYCSIDLIHPLGKFASVNLLR
jgi:hypothetical protein